MDPVNEQTEQTEQDHTQAAEAAEDTGAQAESVEPVEPGDAPEEAPADDDGDDMGVQLDEIIDMEKLQLQKTITERDDRIASLESQLSELTARLRTVSAAYKKQQDDVAATRKRLERHAAQREEVRRGEVVSGLFEPVENLRRSRDALSRSGVDGDNLTGLDMVIGQFMTAFEGLGLEEVPGKGARFDPNLHEALTMMPVMDPALDDVVVEVFSAGYRVGTRLIQPARVVVGSYTAPEVEEEEIVDAEVVEDGGVEAGVAEDAATDADEAGEADAEQSPSDDAEA
jgi:molecular chaperone GrpE